MTPQLQQAIKLLQLSRMELETAVRKELEENPILEETQDLKEEDLKRTKEAADTVDPQAENASNDQDPQKQDEFEWESYLENSYKPPQQSGGGNEEIMNYENVISTTESLHDYLNWQAKMFGFADDELMLAEILINYIDDDGYLLTPLAEIAESEKVDAKDLEAQDLYIEEYRSDPRTTSQDDMVIDIFVPLK